MALAMPLTISQRINSSRRAKHNKEKIAGTTKVNKSTEAKYRRALTELVNEMVLETANALFEPLRRLEPEYVKDDYASVLTSIFTGVSSRWRNVLEQAELAASQMVNDVEQRNRQRTYNAIEGAIGINLNGIIQEEGIQSAMNARISENVALIQTIPDQYFKEISQIIFEGTQRQQSAQDLIKEIIKKSKSTRARAKLIARDQVQKTNAVITQLRQESLGIEEYVWRTSEDERVRDTHRVKNGKTFRWDKPPADTGHPGHDINCRCYAAPVIKLE